MAKNTKNNKNVMAENKGNAAEHLGTDTKAETAQNVQSEKEPKAKKEKNNPANPAKAAKAASPANSKTKNVKSKKELEAEKEAKDINTIENIINNYKSDEVALVSQLYFEVTAHGTTIGGFREDIWREMFKQIIPKKFSIEQSVFIIDSNGNVSNEVDLAIFDETYTPYIFHYGRLKFLPVEAVAVAIECKSQSLSKDNLVNWSNNIKNLKTSSNSYTRMATGIVDGGDKTRESTQTSTRPLRILCCMKNISDNTNKKAEAEKDIDENKDIKSSFDIIIKAPLKDGPLIINFNEKFETLQDWYLALNHALLEESDLTKLVKQATDPNCTYILKKDTLILEKGTDKSKDTLILEEGTLCEEELKIKMGNGIKDIQLTKYNVKEKGEKSVSLLEFNLKLNQILMLINNPILFPHMAYAELFNKRAKKESEEENK